MEIRFDDQVVVVTGAAGNLGRSYALEVARRGGAVVANDLGSDARGYGRSTDALDRVVSEIRAAGGRAVASYHSVADPAGGEAIFRTAIDSFGKVDALINNAGNMRVADFEDIEPADLESLLSVHVLGAFHVTRPIYRHMKERGYGRILFTGSGAMFGNPTQAVYGSAKGAVAGLMNALAVEGAPFGVLCNAILPAAETRMSGVMKPESFIEIAKSSQKFRNELKPENCAALAVYLVSEQCRSTHAMYSAVGNRFARVFIGVNEGWLAERKTVATVEEIAGHFDRIYDPGPVSIPASMVDEYWLIDGLIGKSSASAR